MPAAFAWERFATEERKVTWDGYVSDDGVLYGLPGQLELAGKQVQVRERKGVLSVWSQGKQVFEIAKRPRSKKAFLMLNSGQRWLRSRRLDGRQRHGPSTDGT